MFPLNILHRLLLQQAELKAFEPTLFPLPRVYHRPAPTNVGVRVQIPSGLSQRLPYFSSEVANITSALFSMVGAMNNMTTTWRQAVTQTAEMSAVIVATDMVRDSADFTEDEKIRLLFVL
jgi:hypothetical protein